MSSISTAKSSNIPNGCRRNSSIVRIFSLARQRGRIWRIVPMGMLPRWPTRSWQGHDGRTSRSGTRRAPGIEPLLNDCFWSDRILVTKCRSESSCSTRRNQSHGCMRHGCWNSAADSTRRPRPGSASTDASPRSGTRAALAERWLATDQAIQQRVRMLADDNDPQVRFQVALSLGAWPDDRAVLPLARIALAQIDDPWTRLAVQTAVPRRAGARVAAYSIVMGELLGDATPERLNFVSELAALDSPAARQEPREVGEVLQAAFALEGSQGRAWQMAVRRGWPRASRPAASPGPRFSPSSHRSVNP